jgi:hydroxymethylglutaryl-CoA synthase
MKIGIDSISFDVAKTLTYYNFSEAEILNRKNYKGLGLFKMTLADFHQDPVVFCKH